MTTVRHPGLPMGDQNVGAPTGTNKKMICAVTVADGDLACVRGVEITPVGYLAVEVNGVWEPVGNGVKVGSCYFSSDGGATARCWQDIVAGDLCYWVGSVAGYQLDASDRISFHYEA